MTLHRPEDVSVVRRFLEDIKPAHLLMAAATCVGAYYGVRMQMASVQQTQAEQARQIEQLNADMTRKVDKELYAVQQQEIHFQLNRISDTTDRIEQNLTDHPRH